MGGLIIQRRISGIALCVVLACFCLCVKAKDVELPDVILPETTVPDPKDIELSDDQIDDPLGEPAKRDEGGLKTYRVNSSEFSEHPEEYGARYGVSLKAGTMGSGAEFAVGLSELYNIRAGFAYFVYSSDFEEDDFGKVISGKLGLRSISVLGDWHLFRNNFRLSAGLFFCNNKGSIEAEPGFELALDDEDYFVDSFTGGIRFNNVNPYFGLGYGNMVKRGGPVVFSMDFGVMYHGTPRIFAEATASDPRFQQALQRDLDKELDDLRDDLRNLRFYPVINIGLVYRF